MISFLNCLDSGVEIRWRQICPKGACRILSNHSGTLGRDIHYSNRMLEAMKSFMSAFMVSQRVGAIQWPTRSSDSSEGEDNEGEVEPTKGNKKVEAAEDKASEGHEITP
ncbi:hypothetical protein J1N35_001908 [Gossypium stocksii]|uniref:Uncharacterized protein n=1 Tax=Gossypium stocksii TaxID=47602 RepID=A0A9D4AK18_9ROSI|nr:hypothetical protein J1N35_001908 [Gossypium stocksii]